MRLLLCDSCGDVVAPARYDLRVRWCDCGRFAVWWRVALKNQLSVHDTQGLNHGAWVLDVENGRRNPPNKAVVRVAPECSPSAEVRWDGALPEGTEKP